MKGRGERASGASGILATKNGGSAGFLGAAFRCRHHTTGLSCESDRSCSYLPLPWSPVLFLLIRWCRLELEWTNSTVATHLVSEVCVSLPQGCGHCLVQQLPVLRLLFTCGSSSGNIVCVCVDKAFGVCTACDICMAPGHNVPSPLQWLICTFPVLRFLPFIVAPPSPNLLPLTAPIGKFLLENHAPR